MVVVTLIVVVLSLQVLLLLKKYLFCNVRLFDPNDRLYVNCESDPLGKALEVKRFHFNDVR